MMVGTEHLSGISAIAAALSGLGAFFVLRHAEATARALAAFPRNRRAGWVLAAIALIGSAMLVDQMTLGGLSKYKSLLVVITPVTFYLVTKFLDELLAARALGGLLMLIPTFMVDAARWHPSPWRLVVVSVAYIMVIAGIWIVLSPYKFRAWTSWLMATGGRRTVSGITLVALAAALAITAVVSR
ncbi:MAG TPA: hypothetical protein PKE26_01120 [Kiritimatiellia bacterium]|nr:hypothetical protein [Kiritimatiellia bacterium]HMO97694.1 hypothetical protein [Kiritimatiellia bacterium]HMP95554.1 hypothetical protein [Kiritimatiellia bacterium]